VRELGQYSKANSLYKTRIGESRFLFLLRRSCGFYGAVVQMTSVLRGTELGGAVAKCRNFLFEVFKVIMLPAAHIFVIVILGNCKLNDILGFHGGKDDDDVLVSGVV
jgi:hypothetical protein